MSELLNSGRFGLGKSTKEEIVRNWEDSGLLHGIEDEPLKEKVALTLEDVAEIMLNMLDYNAYGGRFDTIVFPITRRIFSDIDKGRFSYLVKGDYEEMKAGLIGMVTADFIIKKGSKLFIPTFNFFEKIYKDEKNVDIEAEACAFIAERVTQMYLREFRGQKIMNGDNGYFTIPELLVEPKIIK